MLFGLDPATVIARMIVLIFAFTLHEFAHAWTATQFGDDTPRLNGRLTLNPLAHLDLLGSLLLLFRGFGWANDFNAPDYIQVADPLTLAGNTALHLDSTPIIDIVLPKKEVYGGNNQSALETNIFIPASPIIDIADLNPIVYGGDTFIGMYTLQSGMIELSEDFYKNALPHDSYKTSETITEVYPVECSFNIDLAYGATIKTQVKYTV